MKKRITEQPRPWRKSCERESCYGDRVYVTEEIMQTQLYDKVDEYKTLDYTNNSYKQEDVKETIDDLYKILCIWRRLALIGQRAT